MASLFPKSPRLIEIEKCDRALRRICEELLSEAAAGREMSPAAAWLVDNYDFVHAQVGDVREALPPASYRRLPRPGLNVNMEPRIYYFATVLVGLGGALNQDRIKNLIEEFHKRVPLTIAELWALGPMLKLALLEALYRAASGSLDTPESETAIRGAVLGLRTLELSPWREILEAVSVVDRVLRQDPAGMYSRLDFQTRDACRSAIEGIACRSPLEEEEVASLAVELACQAALSHGICAREAHVGYFLYGPGSQALKARAGCGRSAPERMRDLLYRYPNVFYLGGIAAVTLALLRIACRILEPAPCWYVALLVIPVSQVALTIVNRFVNLLLPPRRLPRLDFKDGVPSGCRTFVVIPSLLLSLREVETLLERLEIHYLANRDPNLYFGLLTDFPDSASPAGDQSLLEACAEGIRILNRRYADAGRGPFYLFHRALEWNESESVWMGRERKRGKLNDFNALLVGAGDAFAFKAGDLSVLSSVRYVITLDSDTQLPRETARELIATMAHPLNRPVIDPATKTVREGYAILQPRVSISMESAAKSRIARIYGGQTGLDPYTTAVSDVYHDLHAQASFTGKGIYDVRAFHRVMDGRFPDNTLLSHDLIEGEHARVGLVTDLEVIDDYPSTYESYCKRKHRWVRGDWQIAPWLTSVVAEGNGRQSPNSLGPLSRWKIFDNLRRSLFEITLVALLLASWFGLAGEATRATLLVMAVLLAPAYVDLLFALPRLPRPRLWTGYVRELGFRFLSGHLDAAINLAFLAHQSLAMMDAIVRTLVRRFITHRKLLEWQTMAQSEASAGSGVSLLRYYLMLCPALALLTGFVLAGGPLPLDDLRFLLLELWILSPLAAMWVDGRPYRARNREKGDPDFLREICLRTWRYFVDFATPENHWLAPDNVQEDPPAEAHRTSPTNLGLQLTANLAAHDFGYVTHQELAMRLDQILGTMNRLETCRGHFYNWYDTRTLQPLPPRFISTVDSGNLATSLIALKQGCASLADQPLIDSRTLSGLRDHCLRFRNSLPHEARSGSIMRLIDSFLRQLSSQPTDLFFWEGVLSELSSLTVRLAEPVGWICNYLEERGSHEATEIRYWFGVLAARVEIVLNDLFALAPWLAQPFETELRLCSMAPAMSELIAELCRVPRIADLPQQYENIARVIRGRLDSDQPLHAATRRVIEDLLRDLPNAGVNAQRLLGDWENQQRAANLLATHMDFAFLFEKRRKLLRTGYDADSGALDDSYYDLLASEARCAVFMAIAKGDIPREAWFHLGRKLTSYHGHRTLVSWSGTMFEYLMPALYMKTYEHTLLKESLEAIVRIQRQYGDERKVPWGISEAACSTRDHALSYQYRAFGITQVAANPRLAGNLVIAPYATMLSAMVDRHGATKNLRRMASYGWMGRYGFYESVDYTSREPVIVRSFMAHHQAMGLLALSNVLFEEAMQTRFHADPLVLATDFLLQERLPALLDLNDEQPRLVRWKWESLQPAGVKSGQE